ncbi:MAG: hypothetical protein ABJP34_13460 [Erythrobacter sp.]
MFSAKEASPHWRLAIMALFASTLTAGCTVHSEPSIQGSTGNAAGMRDVAILETATDQSLRTAFAEHLKIAFRARGVPADSKAEIMGDFAVSTMPADMSIATSNPDAPDSSTSAGLIVQSAQRQERLFDNCEAVRYRATLVLFNRSSGERVHRAAGESQGCVDDPVPLNELADLLVRDALLAPN